MAYPTLLLESAHRGADPAVVDRDAILLSVMHFSEAGAKFLFGDLIFNNVPVGTGASEGNGSVVLSEMLATAGGIFVGLMETPLLVRPYLERMTRLYAGPEDAPLASTGPATHTLSHRRGRLSGHHEALT